MQLNCSRSPFGGCCCMSMSCSSPKTSSNELLFWYCISSHHQCQHPLQFAGVWRAVRLLTDRDLAHILDMVAGMKEDSDCVVGRGWSAAEALGRARNNVHGGRRRTIFWGVLFYIICYVKKKRCPKTFSLVSSIFF